MGTNDIPAAFAGFDELEGLDIADKAQFVGEPLGITAIRFRLNERGVLFAEAEVMTAQGSFAINDSSTGVRDQLLAYLANKGTAIDTTEIEPGEATAWHQVKIYAARGLRVSTYDVIADGQTKKSKTYYITTSGRHADPGPTNPEPDHRPKAARGADKPAAA